MFTTPPLERVPHRIALNVRSVAGASGGPTLAVVVGRYGEVGVILGRGTVISGWSGGVMLGVWFRGGAQQLVGKEGCGIEGGS